MTLLLTGCVERRFVVTTDPPGALVMRNNAPIGFAPADDHFVYYGNYHFTLIKDGYETQQIDQKIPAPWYEYPPFDFFTENLLPWHIIDVRRFHYQMQPRVVPNADEITPIAPGVEPSAPPGSSNPPPGTIPSTIYPPG